MRYGVAQHFCYYLAFLLNDIPTPTAAGVGELSSYRLHHTLQQVTETVL